MPKLDTSQRAFCETTAGNIRLLAPAGCGKTLSLAHRCVHLQKSADGQKARFLIVTFTVAAKHELLGRLTEDSDFRSIRDLVEVSTLNAWGYRRVRTISFSPKLITSKADKHFAMLNQLQPIWRKHTHVKRAIEEKKQTTPRKLMELIDELKSLGFDHREHRKKEAFAAKINDLNTQGLQFKIDELADKLAALLVLERKVNRAGNELPSSDVDELYKRFFRFWCEATEHLASNDTFTLEDQKYVAYLDEKQKLDEGKFLSGAARYDHVLVDEFQDINPLDLALIRVCERVCQHHVADELKPIILRYSHEK